MDEEPVGLAVVLAVGAQDRADVLRLLARVGEDEALLAPGVLKDVGAAGVGVRGGGVGRRLRRGPGADLHARAALLVRSRVRRHRPLRDRARRQARGAPGRVDRLDVQDVGLGALRGLEQRLRRLGAGGVEVLHAEAPHARRLLHARDDRLAPGAGGEEGAHGLRVADGRGKPDAARVDARHAREPLDEAQALAPAVAAQK